MSNATGIDGSSVSINVGAGFVDPDGDALTFTASGLPTGLSIDPTTGAITGTLAKNASVGGPLTDGVYPITVTVTDAQGAAITRTFSYTASNPPPTAGNDDFAGVEDNNITGSVTANDQDPDGDALTYAVVSGPSHGTLVFNTNGTFTYTPDANYNATDGRDTFVYRITDTQGATATATVTLTVTPVNDAPVASNVTGLTTPEDTPLSGTLTATDVDHDVLAFTTATPPAHGNVVLNSDGTYVYTPSKDYVGPDSFTYTVSDGNGGTVTRSVSINVTPVNDPPVAVDDVVAVTEDTPVNGNVLGNDTDVENNTLTVLNFTVGATTYTPGTSVTLTAGTLVINGNGTFTFTPAANYNGPVPVVSYTASDGNGGTDTGDLKLGPVTAANDPPVATPSTSSGNEDTSISVDLKGTDIDGTISSVKVTALPPASQGVLYLSDGVTKVTAGTALTPTQAANLVFVPAANFNGTVTITFTVTDNGGATSAPASEVITVTAVNDAPVGTDATFTGPQDIPITGSVVARDVDGDALTFSGPVQAPAHGTVVVNADGTFRFTPDFGYSGADSFVVLVSDGKGGTARVTVTLNLTPIATTGPETDPVRAPGQPLAPMSTPLVVDGIVLDAVSGVAPLDLGKIDFNLGGIVLNTVNSLGRLDGVGEIGQHQIVSGNIIERQRDIERLHAQAFRSFPDAVGTWDAQALTGFSLRMDVGSNVGLDGSSRANQLVVETLVRDRIMFVQISDTLDRSGDVRVVDYQVLLADGRPLPRWVNPADRGMLLVEVPVDGGTLDLKITARLSDGTHISRLVTIQNASGEVQELLAAVRSAPLFQEQFRELR